MTKVRLISWNVNGIRVIHRKGFIDWFAEEETDVLCLQETKVQIDQLPKNSECSGIYQLFQLCRT